MSGRLRLDVHTAHPRAGLERPLVFSLAELKRLPSVSRIYFLECSGNFPRNAPEEITPQQVAPLTSTSEWTIPVEKAWDDALVAYGQNGEALRPEQGYPVRLLCPGREGNRRRS